MKRLFIIAAFLLGMSSSVNAAVVECQGRFVNPITDVCWLCMFPMSIGSAQISAGVNVDTANPASPI